MQISAANSTSQARNILSALKSGNDALLSEQLHRLNQAEIAGCDAFEYERMELLSEIARELERANEPRTDGVVCEMLLHHLAAPAPRRSNVFTMPWVGDSRSGLSGSLLQ